MTAAPLGVLRLGSVPYAQAHALQRELADRRASGEIGEDLLLLLEHERTVTLGRSTRESSLPLPPEELARRGITVSEVERGGDVTWHGPGQLVGYPILDLTGHREDLHWYLRQVEEVVIRALAGLGLAGARRPGLTGVWIGTRKIASIGVHVRRWVTTHGFALNVTNALDDFALIVPCGIAGVEITTVARELLGDSPPSLRQAAALRREAEDGVVAALGQVFALAPYEARLEGLLPGTAGKPGPLPQPSGQVAHG